MIMPSVAFLLAKKKYTAVFCNLTNCKPEFGITGYFFTVNSVSVKNYVSNFRSIKFREFLPNFNTHFAKFTN